MKKLSIFIVIAFALCSCNNNSTSKNTPKELTPEEITKAILNDKFYTPARSMAQVHGPAHTVKTYTKPYSNSNQASTSASTFINKVSFDEQGNISNEEAKIDNSIMNIVDILNVVNDNINIPVGIYNDNYQDNSSNYNIVLNNTYIQNIYHPVQFVSVINNIAYNPSSTVNIKIDNDNHISQRNIVVNGNSNNTKTDITIHYTWSKTNITQINCKIAQTNWVITFVYNDRGYVLESTITGDNAGMSSICKITYTYTKFDKNYSWIERVADVEITINGQIYKYSVLQTREIEYFNQTDQDDGDDDDDYFDKQALHHIILAYNEALFNCDVKTMRKYTTRTYFAEASGGASDAELERDMKKIIKQVPRNYIERFKNSTVESVIPINNESLLVTLEFPDHSLKTFELAKEDGEWKIDMIMATENS